MRAPESMWRVLIYILLSIKTRIETLPSPWGADPEQLFISYYPLKQGLKLNLNGIQAYYAFSFISYYPLKQGLKLFPLNPLFFINQIYILLSIKTRIETFRDALIRRGARQFISYYPLKQGLKQIVRQDAHMEAKLFISYYPLKQGLKPFSQIPKKKNIIIYILLSIKTRIETPPNNERHDKNLGKFISYYPLKQGLKLC